MIGETNGSSRRSVGTVRTALVTGASRGIGRGIAQELARQGFGLTITARSVEGLANTAEELMALGASRVEVHAADLADRAAMPALVERHGAAYGDLSALILNGGVGAGGTLEEMSARRIDKVLEVNFVSAVHLTRAALPLLRAAATADPARGARVVMLSSITGVYSEPGLAVYGASKAALGSFAATLNAEESGRGVMATAIAPGYVDTDMAAWTHDSIAPDAMIPVADVVAMVRTILDLGRTTSVAQVVLSRSGTAGYQA